VLLFVNVERLRLALVADQTQVPSVRLRLCERLQKSECRFSLCGFPCRAG